MLCLYLHSPQSIFYCFDDFDSLVIEECVNFYIFVIPVIDFLIHHILVGNILFMISPLLNLLRLNDLEYGLSQGMFRVPFALEKNVYSAVVGEIVYF